MKNLTWQNIIKAIVTLATIFGLGAQGIVAQNDASATGAKVDKAYDLLRDVVMEQSERISRLETMLMEHDIPEPDEKPAPSLRKASPRKTLPVDLDEALRQEE